MLVIWLHTSGRSEGACWTLVKKALSSFVAGLRGRLMRCEWNKRAIRHYMCSELFLHDETRTSTNSYLRVLSRTVLLLLQILFLQSAALSADIGNSVSQRTASFYNAVIVSFSNAKNCVHMQRQELRHFEMPIIRHFDLPGRSSSFCLLENLFGVWPLLGVANAASCVGRTIK